MSDQGATGPGHTRLEQGTSVVAEACAACPYFTEAQQWTHLFWAPATPIRRFFERLNLTAVVELACRHGRHAANIVQAAGHIMMIDIFEDNNLAACRARLGAWPNVALVKSDGSSFRPIEDHSTTAIYCHDAMEHFSPEMGARLSGRCGEDPAAGRRRAASLLPGAELITPQAEPARPQPHTAAPFVGMAGQARLRVTDGRHLALGLRRSRLFFTGDQTGDWSDVAPPRQNPIS